MPYGIAEQPLHEIHVLVAVVFDVERKPFCLGYITVIRTIALFNRMSDARVKAGVDADASSYKEPKGCRREGPAQ